MVLNFPGLFRRDERTFKHLMKGAQTDTVAQGNSDNYCIVGSNENFAFNLIGVMGASGTFRNLIVKVGANGTGTTTPDAHVKIERQNAPYVSKLIVLYGASETGTKKNLQNEFHVDEAERVAIEILGGEGGTTISQVSWSVDFFEDDI